jgi:hypothetical protein
MKRINSFFIYKKIEILFIYKTHINKQATNKQQTST